jgi:hypothetical protein
MENSTSVPTTILQTATTVLATSGLPPSPTTTGAASTIAPFPLGKPVLFAIATSETTPLRWGTTFCIVVGILWFSGMIACLVIYRRSYDQLIERRRRRQTNLSAMLVNDGSEAGSPTGSPKTPIVLDESSALARSVDYTTISFSESGEPYATKEVAALMRPVSSSSFPRAVSGSRTRSETVNSDDHLLEAHRVDLQKEETRRREAAAAAHQQRVSTSRSGVSHSEVFGTAPLPPPLARNRFSAPSASPDFRGRNYFDDNDHLVPPPRPIPMSHQRVPMVVDDPLDDFVASGLHQEIPTRVPSLRTNGRVFAGGQGGVTIRGVEGADI